MKLYSRLMSNTYPSRVTMAWKVIGREPCSTQSVKSLERCQLISVVIRFEWASLVES